MGVIIMKKFIIPVCCIILILLVLLNINMITDKIINILNHPNYNSLDINNPYYKDNNYDFVTNTKNFVPYGKQDLLNIIYTVINAKEENFTFYCPKEYQNCINDVNVFSNDANLLTHLNNFVHPFNSFTSINTTISDSGEISLKVKYLYTEEEIMAVDQEVRKLMNTIITDDLKTDYDKIKAVHDYIINNTKYDLKDNKDLKTYNAYGALFNHMATCNGYTDLMAIFLTDMGYDNYKIATTNGNGEETLGHVWNAVKIKEQDKDNNEINDSEVWVHLDLTWDDPVSSDNKDYLYHKYLLINTEELEIADSNITSNEHKFDKTIYSEMVY